LQEHKGKPLVVQRQEIQLMNPISANMRSRSEKTRDRLAVPLGVSLDHAILLALDR
jgi:hypothetical protein